MKFLIVVIAVIALFGGFIEANPNPQQPRFQKLPYYPPPTRPPRPVWVWTLLKADGNTNQKIYNFNLFYRNQKKKLNKITAVFVTVNYHIIRWLLQTSFHRTHIVQ